MDLLPKIHSDFNSVKYWEDFFSKRKKAFEWYGSYIELCGILHRYIKQKDDVLVVGCGNSELSEQLYDAGFCKITNIDISKTAIKQMQNRNKTRTEMQWIEMDITEMKLEDNSCSVVIDKGTLDAMMPDTSDQVNEKINKMFSEISRVLRLGGRYVCISLAQDHILQKLLDYFPVNNWLLRIHKVWTAADLPESAVQMPVFTFILTKFKKMPQKILEVCLEDSTKPTRINSEEDVIDFVKTQQYYSILRSKLSQDGSTENMPPVTLFSSDNLAAPRYTIHVLQPNVYSSERKYGIFIVPSGRESEWLFSSDEGRRQVADSARFKRLAIVSLSRDHVYEGGMQQIQSELSSKVMELAPANLSSHYKVPFLSVGGDDIGERYVRHRGHSDMTGDFVVEDYLGDGDAWYRQLLFQSTLLIQTVVKLKEDKRKVKPRKKNRQKKSTSPPSLALDPSYFASEYQRIMVAGLTGVASSINDDFRVLMIGLGGGSLALHMLHIFKHCHVTAVEIDAAMVEVAETWFGLSPKIYQHRLTIHTKDGLDFIGSLANSESLQEGNSMRYDVVIFDADSKDDTSSVRGPPKSFVTSQILQQVHQLLTDNGMLMINLVSRDESAKEEVYHELQKLFPRLLKRKCTSDVNEVVFCCPSKKDDIEYKPNSTESSCDVVERWRSRAKTWEADWLKSGNASESLDLSDLLNDVVKIS